MIKLSTLLKESKQVGILYHYTTLDSALDIIKSTKLIASEAADSTYTNSIFAISFTRDKRFHTIHNVEFAKSSFGSKPQVRFTVNGDRLSNKYKITPYSQGGYFDKGEEGFEAEERVISNKSFSIIITPYIISVDILFKTKKPTNDDWEEEIDYKMNAPGFVNLVKLLDSEKIPINLIVNKNGDPWPDKVKENIIQKILNWIKRL